MTTIKTNLVCRQCGASWINAEMKREVFCPYCGKRKDARDRREEAKKYKKSQARKESMMDWCAVKENARAKGARYRLLLKKRVFFLVCGDTNFKCSRCGCDDFRLLEVNHKDGGGGKELAHGKLTHNWYVSIANGKRNTDDLELLCRPCNAIHYLELKYGPLPIRVVWGEK